MRRSSSLFFGEISKFDRLTIQHVLLSWLLFTRLLTIHLIIWFYRIYTYMKVHARIICSPVSLKLFRTGDMNYKSTFKTALKAANGKRFPSVVRLKLFSCTNRAASCKTTTKKSREKDSRSVHSIFTRSFSKCVFRDSQIFCDSSRNGVCSSNQFECILWSSWYILERA
jgi:hypothetical protein